MKFSTADISAITEAPSLIEDIAFLTNCDTTSYPYADRLRNINAHYYEVVSDINEADGIWPWDDINKTDLPRADDTLVAGQQNMALPTDLMEIIRIEVKDSGAIWQKLIPITEREITEGLAEYLKTNGLPEYYRPIANEVELYPPPAAASVTLSGGFRVYYKRPMTEFTKSDTTKTPGFDSKFHRVLSLGASLDYFLKYPDPQRQAVVERKYNEMRRAIRKFYGKRNKDMPNKITLKQRSFK